MTFDWGYRPEVDFTAPKSFTWMLGPPLNTGDSRIDDPLLEKRIRDAVALQLQGKGYTWKLAAPADFYVAYQVVVKEKLRVTPSDSVYGFNPSTGWQWHHQVEVSSGETGGSAYVQNAGTGSLILDIMEPQGTKLVWRGVVDAHIRPDRDSEKKKIDRINEAVRRLLDPFPPRRRAVPSGRRHPND
jgi:hypothetical protein